MAATVVSVVIFLCGVLVGRGVRAEHSGEFAANTNPEGTAMTPQQPAAAPQPAPAGSDPTAAAPPPAATDDLTYFNRLEKQKAGEEKLKAAAAAPHPAPPATPPETKSQDANPPEARPEAKPSEPKPSAAASTPAPAPAPPAAAAPPPAPAEPAGQSGQGYAVQVAALNIKGDAEAIAKRLSSKGYAAYVLAPASGTPSVYRVRVGKFPTRREADSIAARLKREEQFNPWVTR